MAGVIAVTRTGLQATATAEQLGELFWPLRPEPVLMSPEYAAKQAAEEAAQLREAGLVGGDGRPTPDLVDCLVALCRPSIAYIAFASVDDEVATALTLRGSGTMAVCVAARGRDVWLREIDHDQLVPALFGELPEIRPGQGDVVKVNLDDRRRQRESTLEGPPDHALGYVRDIAELPAAQTVDITIEQRDGNHMRRTRHPLGLKLTDSGDYFACHLGTGPDEEVWAGPASDSNLKRALAAMESDLNPAGV